MSDDDDPLLRACAALEREDEASYPTLWEDALAGRGTMEAARAASEFETGEDRALRDLLSGPIAGAEVDALVHRALAVVAERAPSEPSGVDPPISSSPVSAPAAGVVVPLRRRWWKLAAASAVAAAAAILLMISGPDPGGVEALVHYEFALREPGVELVRSTASRAELRQYQETSTIDWVWSPEVAVEPGAALYGIARGTGGAERLLTPEVTRSATGTLRLRGRIDQALGLAPGRWRLQFLVLPGGRLDDPAAAIRALSDGSASPAGEVEIEIVATEA